MKQLLQARPGLGTLEMGSVNTRHSRPGPVPMPAPITASRHLGPLAELTFPSPVPPSREGGGGAPTFGVWLTHSGWKPRTRTGLQSGHRLRSAVHFLLRCLRKGPSPGPQDARVRLGSRR